MEPMGWGDYFIVLGCCAITMLVCRVVPLFVLKGKELPEGVGQALGFIPPAAFAALVANDLLTPGMFDAGLWPAAAPLIAALAVALVAWKTKSLLWCAVSGVAAYALLMLLGRPGRKRGGIRHYAWRAQVFAHVPRFFLAVPFR